MTNSGAHATSFALSFASTGALEIRGSGLFAANDPCSVLSGRSAKIVSSVCISGFGTALFVGSPVTGFSAQLSSFVGGSRAVQLLANGARISQSAITAADGEGLSVSAFDCVITRNSITANGEDGIALAGSGGTITGNTIQGNGGCGIHLFGNGPNTVLNNTLSGNLGGETCGP
jgi:parallel beta-helix repeat protein